MKPTRYTICTMNIKKLCAVGWLIGNYRDEPLTQRRKSYNIG